MNAAAADHDADDDDDSSDGGDGSNLFEVPDDRNIFLP